MIAFPCLDKHKHDVSFVLLTYFANLKSKRDMSEYQKKQANV